MDAPERWLPVPGYEGFYEVSDLGNVWSTPRPRTPGGLMKPVAGPNGYRQVTLTMGGKQKRVRIHRLVMLVFEGPCPEGMEVRHLDGNVANNRRDNLAYSDHRTNMHDKRVHGTDHNTNKTHCSAGHKYTPENTMIYDGGRYCRECSRENGRRYWDRLRAEGKIVRMADLPPELQEKKRAADRERKRRKRERQRSEEMPDTG